MPYLQEELTTEISPYDRNKLGLDKIPVTDSAIQRETKKPVSVLSSSNVPPRIREADKRLAQIAPPPAEIPKVTETKPEEPKKIEEQDFVEMLNPATGETITYNNPSLNKSAIDSQIAGGWGIVKSKLSTPLQFGQTTKVDTDDEDLKNLTSTLNTLKEGLTKFTISDAETQATVNNITSSYDTRINQMNEINRRRKEAMNTLGVRLGSRWSGGQGGMFGGIVAEEERQGVQRIAELKAQKQSAISAAKEAQRKGNWDVYVKQVDLAEKAVTNKTTEIEKLNKLAIDQQKKLSDTLRQSEKDFAISKLFTQGITDPAKILMTLKEQGFKDITDKDVNSVLDTVRENTGISDLTKLNSGTETFFALKKQTGGLPVDILALPTQAEQLFEFLKRFNEATKPITDYQQQQLEISKQKVAQSQQKITSGSGTQTDVKVIADAIVKGIQPPDLSRLYGKAAGVRAELARQGYDLTKATQEWTALQRYISSTNSTQQIRLRQAETSVEQALDNLETISNDWKRTGFAPGNRAEIYAASQGIGSNKDKASEFITQLNIITDEMAVVLQGGNTPTERSMELASGMLNKNLGTEQLLKQVEIIRKNLQYRKNSWSIVQPLSPTGTNQYSQPNLGSSNPEDFLNNPLPSSGTYSPDVWSKIQ